ncbi:MAG: hypothetical protein UR66_C0004G0083 [Candidatus Moranbacteria bacterium GW2011_GWE1_35_17]|nr:MAG: hypothetical protein UR66_C0004G0083 [Candidatus Moranbacteria bacterium GW2011_GWE1_35_17]KKP84652.1 MAG: hypothetical protein UR82_C0001G0019 [Candidatus Moranbacteria bacterium GW2011_GWF1_35_5]
MINKEVTVLHVEDEDKIYPSCPNCKFIKESVAPPDVHRIRWRCPSCKEKTPFKVNWRKGHRKEYGEKMNIGTTQVSILDLSLDGLSFKGEKLNILPKTKINIELPLNMVRKDVFYQPIEIEVVSRRNGRYGARFLNLGNESKARKRIGAWLMVA